MATTWQWRPAFPPPRWPGAEGSIGVPAVAVARAARRARSGGGDCRDVHDRKGWLHGVIYQNPVSGPFSESPTIRDPASWEHAGIFKPGEILDCGENRLADVTRARILKSH
jgi:hypothetical protein